MLPNTVANYLNIRISNIEGSHQFYDERGCRLRRATGFNEGYPAVMMHPTDVLVNLLGPSSTQGSNILMDVEAKHMGYIPVASCVESIEVTVATLWELEMKITCSSSQFSKEIGSLHIRAPDVDAIELHEQTVRDLERSCGDEIQSYRLYS